MTVRTATQTDIPAQEQMVEREQWCPPHDFDAAWATPTSGDGDTVPALYCRMCGDIRLFRIPTAELVIADPDDEC
jgi:hypothetical protein